MKPDTSPLVSRLNLIVLTMILGCLVLLVMRAYERPNLSAHTNAVETDTVAAENAANDPSDAISAVIPNPTLKELPRRAPTNIVVATRPRTPTPPANAAKPVLPARSQPGRNPSTGQTGTSRSQRNAGFVAGGINSGGLIAGVVRLDGQPPGEVEITQTALGATCGALHTEPLFTRRFRVGPQGGLADVMVYVRSGLPGRIPPVQPAPILDQIGCMYEPYVMAVVAGQPFQVRNSDSMLHNIHATPRRNREFNIGQAVQGQVNERVFDSEELFIRIKCDVHPWMFAYVSVLNHPYFAVTDANGAFQFPAPLPPGNYTIAAQHQRAGEDQQEVTVGSGEQVPLQFTLIAPSTASPQGEVAIVK